MDWFLTGFFPLTFLPCKPLQLASSEQMYERTKEVQGGGDIYHFCNLIMQVICHNLSTLFIKKRKPLGPAHTQGKGLHRGLNAERQGIFGARREAAYHCLSLREQVCFCLRCIINLREMCIR